MTTQNQGCHQFIWCVCADWTKYPSWLNPRPVPGHLGEMQAGSPRTPKAGPLGGCLGVTSLPYTTRSQALGPGPGQSLGAPGPQAAPQLLRPVSRAGEPRGSADGVLLPRNCQVGCSPRPGSVRTNFPEAEAGLPKGHAGQAPSSADTSQRRWVSQAGGALVHTFTAGLCSRPCCPAHSALQRTACKLLAPSALHALCQTPTMSTEPWPSSQLSQKG